MEKSRKISVVMSVLGYEDYIGLTIESILNQTLDDFEFIIVDDGCSYDLLARISGYGDKRIIYKKNSMNLGLTASLIKGMELSSGKYIARMDAGNISLKDRLKVQYDFLERNEGIFLAGSSIRLIDESGNIICDKTAVTGSETIAKKMLSYNCINHSTIMFRRAGDAGYRSKFRYSQDYDLYLNLLSRGKSLENIPGVLLEERFLSSSITYSKRREQDYYRDTARKFYFQRVELGRDKYDDMKEYEKPHEDQDWTSESRFLLEKQKIYLLLYSGRAEQAREMIKKLPEGRSEFKFRAYYIMSYFPLLLRIMGARRNIKYIPKVDRACRGK